MATTSGAVISVEVWVLVTALLLLTKFVVGSVGPRLFSTRHIIGPMVQVLNMLNNFSVAYTLGLMNPSSDEKHQVGAKVEDFFQVWAVLIDTMQDSVRIGRPYRPVEMTLVDLLSSLWAANQLRVHTEIQLKVPIWLIWSIHASRVIWFFVSSNRAAEASVNNIKLVSDYMMTSQHTTDANVCPHTMRGYRYIVVGEEEQNLMSVRPPGFTLEMVPTRPEDVQLLTVEDVWRNAENSGDRLLSAASDSNSRFKDMCLSFALYKLQRRRFYNFPIAEAAHPATASRLVADAILEEGENGCYERALRITEVELSLLHDSLYSRHAVVFSGGFPRVRLALSLLMTAAALYLAYAVRNIPSTGIVVAGEKKKIVTIAHGVPITRLVIAIILCRELAEVRVYVMSQWSKVRVICHYIRLKEGSWKRFIVEKVARIMFFFVRRGRWNQDIRQYNLLMSVSRINTSVPWVRRIQQSWMLVMLRKVKLRTEVKKAVFESLKALITNIPSAQVNRSPSPSTAEPSSQGGSTEESITQEEMNRRLASYFTNVFAVVNDEHTSSPSSPLVVKDTACDLDGETHKILVWHIATSLCQIKAIQQLEKKIQARMDLYTLAPPKASGGELAAMSMWQQHYMTAVSLSNYCAYLITQGLVPDNGLVSDMVFGAVRDEIRQELARCYTMPQIHDFSMRAKNAGKSILGMGAELSESLMSKYVDQDDILWERLAKFWAGFLLYLSASTRAAKHKIHLQGRGEFTTHLWVLLSHAGFLGKTHHGEQMLDPVDRNDA